MDWKEKLQEMAAGNAEFEILQNENVENQKNKSVVKQHLRIELDKRKGKLATLLLGFEGSEEELKDFARKLKTTCGVGGSTRDGEILIQGDLRKKIADMLEADGYKIRRINF